MTWQEWCRFIKEKSLFGGFGKKLVVINHGIDYHRVSGEFFPFQATFAMRLHSPPIRDEHLQ